MSQIQPLQTTSPVNTIQTGQNNSTTGEMEQTVPEVLKESIHMLVQLFVDQLTWDQQDRLQSRSVDKATENLLTEMCMDIIKVVSSHILRAFNLPEMDDLSLGKSPPSTSSKSGGSWKNVTISKHQVHQCLRDVIPRTFAEVTGVQQAVSCQSAKEVTELMVKEVRERVNSQLSKSSGSIEGCELLGYKSSTRGLKKIGKHVALMLQTARKEDNELTLVMSMGQDKAGQGSSRSSFIDTTTEAVKKILENQVNDLNTPDSYEEFTEEEKHLLEISCSHDSDGVASEIVTVIMDEHDLESDGTPKMQPESEAESGETSCWKRVARKIKAFLFRRFAKVSILSLVAKLRKKCGCFQTPEQTTSLKQLIDVVDWMVEDMIPQEEDREPAKATNDLCVFQKIASDISSGQHTHMVHRMQKKILQHLKPKQERKHCVTVEVQVGVDAFMKMMWDWLNQQVQAHERKRDIVSNTLRQIKELLLILVPLANGPLDEKRHTSTPVSEAALAPTNDEPAISHGADELPREATTKPGEVWDDLSSIIMASAMVDRIMKRTSFTASFSEIKTIKMTMKAMLSAKIPDSGLAFKPTPRQLERVAKAVHEELWRVAGSEGLLRRSMLLNDEIVIEYIVDCIIRKLVKLKQVTIKMRINRVLKTMTKTFTNCFKVSCED